MICYTYRHRVRYRECDPMGVVYHTHYLDYFEAARTEALRSFGLAYKELENNGVIMPVVKASLDYHQPAEYDDLLAVKTTFTEVPSTRVPIDYKVFRLESEELLVSGHVELCFVSKERQRPIPAPSRVVSSFKAAQNA